MWYNLKVLDASNRKEGKKGKDLGVAQLGARYLGVVEAASSSLVTQTISSVHNISELWTLDFFLPVFTFSLIFNFLSSFSALFFLPYIAVGRYSIATPWRESSL